MRTLDVAKRVIKSVLADKRSIALLFLVPIFILLLLNIILTSTTTRPDIDLVSAPKTFVSALEKSANIKNVSTEQDAITDLKNGQADAYVIFTGNLPNITIEGSNPSITGLILGVMKNTIENMQSSVPSQENDSSQIKPEIKFLYGSENMSSFDYLAPLLMGFFIFFFVFLIAGVAFLRERISGTLDRILATPLRRSEIVLGYFIGFGIFVVLQTIIIQAFTMFGLNVVMKGNFWLVLIINLILAGQSLALGTLLSSFAQNEFQLFQFIPLVIVTQTLFSGLFDLREAPQWVAVLSKIFPLTYAAEALRSVMIRGLGFWDIQKNVYILIGYTIVFLVLNTLVLKKHRKI
jgi:ABC-2 type transport system permease protein